MAAGLCVRLWTVRAIPPFVGLKPLEVPEEVRRILGNGLAKRLIIVEVRFRLVVS